MTERREGGTRDCFGRYVRLWKLVPDGAAIVTHSSRLLPVLWRGEPAMLKVACEAEEKFGGLLMRWWDGTGAAKVLASAGDAILLERAQGSRSLSSFARDGRDDEATRIICSVVETLHAPRSEPPPELIPLKHWFRELAPAAAAHGGILAACARTAERLLEAPRDPVVLHGDIHHDNILDFGPRGWLAIDPKRLTGERGFDYANIFTNPDLSDPSRPVATLPGRFESRLAIVCEAARIERRRMLEWILAWCGLSAAWFISDGESPEIDLQIAALAEAELLRLGAAS